jgi:hypothetical protein
MDVARRTGFAGVLPTDTDTEALNKIGRQGVSSATSATPGQFIVRAAGDAPVFVGSSGGGADSALRTDLAAPDGAANVGVRAAPTLPSVDVATAIKAQPLTPEAAGTAANVPGNVQAYTKFLAAQNRAIREPIARQAPMPKLHLTSALGAGKNFHGFPSAVRYNGKDYILYREGTAHVETPPITNQARLVCSVRDVNGIAPESRTIILEVNGTDPRDPNVLRDDTGQAILVGGKFKVVTFEYTGGSYSNIAAKVYDLDPANLGAGLVNPVTIPLPVQAVKSDVRLLSTGQYAFVGYNAASNICHLVTTTDWSTFTTEEIGPGNEAAFCETPLDSTLNVVVRAEEGFGNKAAIFYKRNTAGGPWRVHSVLPYTLNAPTFVKAMDYRSSSTAPGGHEGWLLFARDKTGRLGLGSTDQPTGLLVCFRSKQNTGREIDAFVDRVVIAGTPNPANGVTAGDSHYASVVAGQYSGQLDIYTYGEFITAKDISASNFRIGVFRIEAYIDADMGIRPIMPAARNLIPNSSFAQGARGLDLTNSSTALVTDTVTGRPVLRITNKMTGQQPFVIANCKKGDTLFGKVHIRLNRSNLSGTGRHIQMQFRDGNTDATIHVMGFNPNPLEFGGVARTIVGRPIIATSDKIKIVLLTDMDATLTDAESDIFHLELSDDYSRDLHDGPRLGTIVKSTSANFNTTTGSATSSSTYSASFWTLFPGAKKANGAPIEAADFGSIQLRLDNCVPSSGTAQVFCTGAVVNADGSISANFAAVGGTLTGSVACRAVAVIAAPEA